MLTHGQTMAVFQGAPQLQLLVPEELFHPDLYFQLELHLWRTWAQVVGTGVAGSSCCIRRASPGKWAMGNSLSHPFPANGARRVCANPICQKRTQGAKLGRRCPQASPRAAQMSCFWQLAPHSTLYLCFLTYSTLCQLTHTLCYFNLLLFTDYPKFPWLPSDRGSHSMILLFIMATGRCKQVLLPYPCKLRWNKQKTLHKNVLLCII